MNFIGTVCRAWIYQPGRLGPVDQIQASAGSLNETLSSMCSRGRSMMADPVKALYLKI